MIKNKIRILICTSFLFAMQACSDYVDVVPDNVAVIEDAFASRLSAERFLNTTYSYIPSVVVNSAIGPNIDIGNPGLPASDELWLNDRARKKGSGEPEPIFQILTSRQNVLSPHLDSWGNSAGRNLFRAIRDCNIFLENIHLAFDLNAGERDLWVAEVKFLKAYYHFFLMRMYGPIPITRENLPVSSELDAIRVKRAPIDEVTNYIVELLDEAIPNLFGSNTQQSNELGRATNVMAAVLKARTLVLAASPLFNGNSDYANFVGSDGEALISSTYSQEKWARAETACQEAIDIAHAAGHGLFTAVPDTSWGWSPETQTKMDVRFSVTEPWNREILWGYSRNNSIAMQQAARPRLTPEASLSKAVAGYWSPNLTLAETYYSKNGVPIEEDNSYDYTSRYNVVENVTDHDNYIGNGFDVPVLHLNREPRFYASMGFDGGVWLENQPNEALVENNALVVRGKNGETSHSNGPGGFAFSQTGYYAKKLSNPKNFQGTDGDRDFTAIEYAFPIARLAGLYLLYAEALNENDKTAEAHQWIDMVRDRAGLDGVVNSWAMYSSNPSKPSSKDGFREIVQQERLIELAMEGQRFWDVRRWKTATQLLNRDIRGWNRNGSNTEDYYQVITFGSIQFTTKDYLWPIAEGDIIRNPNLIQNPGW